MLDIPPWFVPLFATAYLLINFPYYVREIDLQLNFEVFLSTCSFSSSKIWGLQFDLQVRNREGQLGGGFQQPPGPAAWEEQTGPPHYPEAWWRFVPMTIVSHCEKPLMINANVKTETTTDLRAPKSH